MTNSRTQSKKSKTSKGTPSLNPDTDIFLSVPFEQSEQLKDEFGSNVRYDPNYRKWYCETDCKFKRLILAKYPQIDKDAYPIDETPEEDKIYINVPYSRLDEAKAIGGIKFNKEFKIWYLIQGGETNEEMLKLFQVVEF